MCAEQKHVFLLRPSSIDVMRFSWCGKTLTIGCDETFDNAWKIYWKQATFSAINNTTCFEILDTAIWHICKCISNFEHKKSRNYSTGTWWHINTCELRLFWKLFICVWVSLAYMLRVVVNLKWIWDCNLTRRHK